MSDDALLPVLLRIQADVVGLRGELADIRHDVDRGFADLREEIALQTRRVEALEKRLLPASMLRGGREGEP